MDGATASREQRGVLRAARDTSAPDATWTAFAPIAVSGGAIGGGSRYLQYRVELTAGDAGSMPSIEQVAIAYSKFP